MIGIDAQFNLISYAVLSTKFEADKNVVLSFLPLVEHVLLNIHDRAIKTTEFIDSFEEMFGYKLPYAIISELLNVLVKKGKISKLRNESLEIYKDKLTDYDLKEEYELRLRALISDVNIFARKKGNVYNRAEIVNLILRFIVKNVIEFNSFILYNSNFESIDESDIEIQEDLVDFLVEERKNNTDNYKFLQDIYYGVVIASLILSADEKAACNVDQYVNSYNIENVLVDSNFVFRILDLQTELEHKVAMDTYHMLKEKGCKFWICKETIKQIADALRYFSDQYSESANKVLKIYGEDKFTGLAAACLRKNLTPSKIEIVINNLSKQIQELGIFLFDEFTIKETDIEKNEKESLYKIKTDASPNGIFHDLMLIYTVRKKRPASIYQMKQAKWWVLTDDNKLTKWNCDISSKNKIQECITEAQIATVMWLNEPRDIGTDSFFTTVLALRNRNLVNNDEYIRISKLIETQKSKYADDENMLEKLTLIFSKQMLRIDDFLEADEDKVADAFCKKMDEASVYMKKYEELKNKTTELENDKAQLTITYEENLVIAEQKTEQVKSVLSKEKLENINLLKERYKDKKKTCGELEKSINLMHTKGQNQIKICRVIFAIVFAGIIYLIAKSVVSHFEQWYSNNELLYEFICGGISCVLSILGVNVVSIFQGTINCLNRVLIKTNIQKDYKCQIEKKKKEKEEIMKEMHNILSKIEEKTKM